MAVRSKRLSGPTDVAAGTTVLVYTVPPAETAVVRSFTIASDSGLASTALVTVEPGGAGGPKTWWRGTINNASTSVLPYLVLNPGDVVRVTNQAAAGAMHVTLAGSELEGAAD